MNGEKLEIAGLAKTVLTSADGRLKEIIYTGNQATLRVKEHTVQRIIQNAGLTQAPVIHMYDLQGNDLYTFLITSVATGTSGNSATGVVIGQFTTDVDLHLGAFALFTGWFGNPQPASAGYASVSVNLLLYPGDVCGITWCLTVS